MTEFHRPTLALIGYGNMGREIEQAALANGYPVNAIIDTKYVGHSLPLSEATLKDVDVCIEFTSPDAVFENITAVASCRKNMVVGTTGWLHRLDEVRSLVEGNGIGLVHASNFSIGIHVFLKVLSVASRIFNAYEQYDVAVQEIHHTQKKDAPSGTALSIARAILRDFPRKTTIVSDRPDGPPSPDQLLVSSTRVGAVPGTHRVLFDSGPDSVELVHTARNRRGFADGALLAASWIRDKKGIFTIEDMLHDFESV